MDIALSNMVDPSPASITVCFKNLAMFGFLSPGSNISIWLHTNCDSLLTLVAWLAVGGPSSLGTLAWLVQLCPNHWTLCLYTPFCSHHPWWEVMHTMSLVSRHPVRIEITSGTVL